MAKAKTQQAEPERAWPALNVQLMGIDEIVENPNNPRIHPPTQIKALMHALKDYGWTIPVLLDASGMLIAGHGRLAAAKLLVKEGREEFAQVPAATAEGWTQAAIDSYVVLDNQLAIISKWDDERLSAQLKKIATSDYSRAVELFSDAELKATLPKMPGTEKLVSFIVQDGEGKGKMATFITIGSTRLACTSEERMFLIERLKLYIDAHGGHHGFVAEIIEALKMKAAAHA